MSAMSDSHDDLEIPSIVPERDELRSHRSTKRGTPIPLIEDTVVIRASGTVRFLLTILVLGMMATGGAGYFFYIQGQIALADLNTASFRIQQLESRLSTVDEAAEQSSVGLLERVDFNFAEIDKLWAARNQNRSDVAENGRNIGNIEETLTSVEAVVTNQSGGLNKNSALLANIQSRLETITSNITGIDNFGLQLITINDDLNLVKISMASLEEGLVGETGLASRLGTTEQDIESINIYRLQLNQTINSMQNNINNLQQRLGQ